MLFWVLSCGEAFDDSDPIGREVKLQVTNPLSSVSEKGRSGRISLSNVDRLTLIPLNFGRNFINLRNRSIDSQIIMKARNGSRHRSFDEVTMVLRAARRLGRLRLPTSRCTATMLSQGFEAVFKGINIEDG